MVLVDAPLLLPRAPPPSPTLASRATLRDVIQRGREADRPLFQPDRDSFVMRRVYRSSAIEARTQEVVHGA